MVSAICNRSFLILMAASGDCGRCRVPHRYPLFVAPVCRIPAIRAGIAAAGGGGSEVPAAWAAEVEAILKER